MRKLLAAALLVGVAAAHAHAGSIELERVAGGVMVVDREGYYVRSRVPLPLGGNVVDALTVGSTLYLARGEEGIAVVDLSNPANPRHVTDLADAGEVLKLDVVDGHLVANRADFTMRAWDLADPLAPKPIAAEALRVEQVGKGTLAIAGDKPPRVGDHIVIRGASGSRGVVEVARVEAGRGYAEMPRGTLADVGDSAERSWAQPEDALVRPRMWRGITRVEAVVRPSLSVSGPSYGFGAQAELAVDHYFRAPFRVGVALTPIAFAAQSNAVGASGLVMASAAVSGDFAEIGLSAGVDLHERLSNGFAFGAMARIGALDGIRLLLAATAVATDGAVQFGSIAAEFDLPVARRFTITAAAGGARGWSYGTLGLKSYLRGVGGPGTIVLATALGVAGLTEADAFNYGIYTLGPALSVGVDMRY